MLETVICRLLGQNTKSGTSIITKNETIACCDLNKLLNFCILVNFPNKEYHCRWDTKNYKVNVCAILQNENYLFFSSPV